MWVEDEGAAKKLVQSAVQGDVAALEQLLLSYHARLTIWLSARLPARYRGLIEPDDIAQETYTRVFRSIGGFSLRGPDSFYAWLTTLAEHALVDVLKAVQRKKRGGDWSPIRLDDDANISVILDLISASTRTPSDVAAGNEAASAIRQALAQLPQDYGQAIQLVYLESRPVAEVAATMNRTEGAVRMLCHRGLRQLHETMGRSSGYFSQKP